MKKSVIVLMVILSFAFLMFSGCSNSGTFINKTFSSEELIINNVILDVSDREVEVTASPDNQIHIDYFESEKEYYNISNTDGTLKMALIFDKNWTDYIGTKANKKYRTIKLEIPNKLLNNLTIRTTNERIKVTELEVKETILLNSNGGNVEFEKLSAGEIINLTAKNGNIKGSVIGGWDDYTIKISIKKGESNLVDKDGGEKVLIADCNNGNININLIK